MEPMEIYCIVNELSDEIIYVGKSRDYKKRFVNHEVQNSLSPYVDKKYLRPELLEVVSADKSKEVESFWINYLRFLGCNLANKQLIHKQPVKVCQRGALVNPRNETNVLKLAKQLCGELGPAYIYEILSVAAKNKHKGDHQ